MKMRKSSLSYFSFFKREEAAISRAKYVKRCLFFVMMLFFCAASFSQNPSQIVSLIDIEGNNIISKDKIVTKIKTRINQPYNENIVSEDIKRIYSLGYFEDISVKVEEKADNKVVVIFVVKEKPVLKSLEIEGYRRIARSKILKAADIKEGTFLEEMKLKQAQEAILDLYTKKGFTDTKVSYDISIDKNSNEAKVVFTIQESGRLRIKRIFVMGNMTFSDKRILGLIKTRKAWFFRAGFFKEKEFEDDLERIKDFYKKEGFQDVEVNYKIETDLKRGLLYITLNITEGKRYKIGKVTIEGFEEISEAAIRKAIDIRSGDIYSEEKVQVQLAKIQEIYFNEGYIFAQIKPLSFVNPDSGLVDVTFQIKENDLVYVRMVDIRGNTKTKDKVIRRELKILPGEKFDGEKLRKSKENLQNLGFFEEVKFDTESTNTPSQQDLIVEVKEAKTGSFSFGGGFSSVDEFIGFLELRQHNFDYKNFPYFTGGGQDLSMYFQTGSITSEYSLSFTNPWIFDKPISFGFDVYRRVRDRESDVGLGYNEKRRGGTLRLGRRFFETVHAGVSYNYETVTISDVDPEASSEFRKEEGENSISTVGLSLSFDTRDNVFVPSKGFLFSNSVDVAGGAFGGDKDFIRVYTRLSQYFPFFKGSVLEARVRAGIVTEYDDSNDVPIYERFFAGGASTIRGYRERKVGPIDTASEDPIGGEAIFVGNLEYTYPLGDFLKVAAFFDSGNVWADYSDFLSGNLKSGIGIGIRVKTPLGPVSIDYGFPLNIEPGEEKREGRFHFNISRGF